jgi:hypothetical protein
LVTINWALKRLPRLKTPKIIARMTGSTRAVSITA